MKTSLKMSVVVGLTAAFVGTGAMAAEKSFNVGGSARWQITNDKHTETPNNGTSTTSKTTGDDGRIKLDIKGRIESESGAWVEAVGQPLFNMSVGEEDVKSISYDDRYVKFGRGNRWDIQLGEFEGFDLFPTGADMAYNAADGKATYMANKVRGRTNDGIAHGALHTNFGKTAFELGIMTGESTKTDENGDVTGDKVTGIRPAIKFDSGRFSVGAGYDYKAVKDTNAGGNSTEKWKGFGITAGTKMGRGNVNFNIASGKGTDVGSVNTPHEKNYADKVKITSIGINGAIGGFNLGIVQDKFKTDFDNKTSDDQSGKQTSIYTAYKIPLMGIKDATATFGVGTSKAKYDNGDNDKDTRVRVRLDYAF